jgi:thioredoxin reductase
VLLCDTGAPRNARSHALHGFLTRDGIAPLELLRLGRAELDRYGIDCRPIEVIDIRPEADAFEVTLADGTVVQGRTVLIACGVTDELPRIPGLADCFGVSAHHCPYCDGWEVRAKSVVVIGQRKNGAALALSMKTWSPRVTLCSNGAARLHSIHREQLAQHDVVVNEAQIASVQHTNGRVQQVIMTTAEQVACEAIFLSTRQRPQCDLARRLGCVLTRHGLVKTDHLGRTGVAGLYVAGDASHDVQFVVVAAAEGAKAGVAINKALQARTGLELRPVP